MKYSLSPVLLLGLIATAGSAFAQTDLSYIFTTRPKNTFSAAISIRSGGGKVSFENLGSVPRSLYNASTATYNYDDGTVTIDGKRPDETATTTVFSADGKRYQTYVVNADNTKTQTGDFLAYQQGQTRYWSYTDPNQAADGNVNMHASRAISEGASAQEDGSGTAGFDVSLNHEFGQLGQHLFWGVSISFGLNDIKAQTNKTVTSTLETLTDKYSLLGQPLPAAFSQPEIGPFQESNGQVNLLGLETTTPLGQTPVSTSFVDVAHGAQVQGNWELKAAYYLIRLGPSFRFEASRHFSVSANFGIAATVAGSTFTSSQQIVSPAFTNTISYSASLRKREYKLGPYAEANLEWWLTGRTGFFVGATYEKLGKYEQVMPGLDNQKVKVDLGSGVAIRLGLITRF